MTVLMVPVPSLPPLRPSHSRRTVLTAVGFAVLWGILTLWASGCGSRSNRTVVLYCAQDQVLAEPLLARFERETGWSVRTVYDSEAVKTVGLANRLLAERSHPVADVFWGNEPFRAHLLIARGVLEGRDTLAVFGRRSRQWVLSEGGLPGGGVPPESLRELTNAAWRGKVIYSENLGSDSFIYVDIGTGEPIIVRQEGKSSYNTGDQLNLGPRGNMFHRFDDAGHPLMH